MSKIEWTEETWNPIIGCSRISEGCTNCYAEKMAKRLASINLTSYYLNVVKGRLYGTPQAEVLPEWNGNTHFVESALDKPLKRKKPTMYFVCSMGDLFHESVPFEWIDMVMEVINLSPEHTFQALTKRPERMEEYFNNINESKKKDLPLNNLWLGVSAENQEQADKRIPILLQIPAAIRFVSIEPMLGNIDLTELYTNDPDYNENALTGMIYGKSIEHDPYMRSKLDWVICGGESGPKARPISPNWVRSVRNQCDTAGTPFFFKQWGEYLSEDYCDKNNIATDDKYLIYEHEHNENYFKVGKKKAGSMLDGKEYKEFPIIFKP